MRKRIRVDGLYYKPVPWLFHNKCDGCALDINHRCINGDSGEFPSACNEGGEFEGVIFIRSTKESLAEYIAKRLDGVE